MYASIANIPINRRYKILALLKQKELPASENSYMVTLSTLLYNDLIGEIIRWGELLRGVESLKIGTLQQQ